MVLMLGEDEQHKTLLWMPLSLKQSDGSQQVFRKLLSLILDAKLCQDGSLGDKRHKPLTLSAGRALAIPL
jgi:hypothetical protein